MLQSYCSWKKVNQLVESTCSRTQYYSMTGKKCVTELSKLEGSLSALCIYNINVTLLLRSLRFTMPQGHGKGSLNFYRTSLIQKERDLFSKFGHYWPETDIMFSLSRYSRSCFSITTGSTSSFRVIIDRFPSVKSSSTWNRSIFAQASDFS